MMSLIATEDEHDGVKGDLLSHRALMVAILDRAISDLTLYANRADQRSSRTYEDAYDWVFYEDGIMATEKGITFPAVCELLDLCPERVRTGIRRHALCSED